MIDWLKKFEERFKDDDRIKKLKEEKFHGYIKINFTDGVVIDLNKYTTIK